MIGDLEQKAVASRRIFYGGAAAAFFVVLQASAFAQGKGTQQQREACTPDAMRLCGAYLLDAGRVEACLRRAGRSRELELSAKGRRFIRWRKRKATQA